MSKSFLQSRQLSSRAVIPFTTIPPLHHRERRGQAVCAGCPSRAPPCRQKHAPRGLAPWLTQGPKRGCRECRSSDHPPAFSEGGEQYLLSSLSGSPLVSTTFERAALQVHLRQCPLKQPLGSCGSLWIELTEGILAQSPSLSGSSRNPLKGVEAWKTLVDLAGADCGEQALGVSVSAAIAVAKSPAASRTGPLSVLSLPVLWWRLLSTLNSPCKAQPCLNLDFPDMTPSLQALALFIDSAFAARRCVHLMCCPFTWRGPEVPA